MYLIKKKLQDMMFYPSLDEDKLNNLLTCISYPKVTEYDKFVCKSNGCVIFDIINDKNLPLPSQSLPSQSLPSASLLLLEELPSQLPSSLPSQSLPLPLPSEPLSLPLPSEPLPLPSEQLSSLPSSLPPLIEFINKNNNKSSKLQIPFYSFHSIVFNRNGLSDLIIKLNLKAERFILIEYNSISKFFLIV